MPAALIAAPVSQETSRQLIAVKEIGPVGASQIAIGPTFCVYSRNGTHGYHSLSLEELQKDDTHEKILIFPR